MEIRIDTSKDSKRDIQKAIKLLQSLIEEGSETGSSFDSSHFPSGENVLGGFFDSPTPSSDSSESSQASIIPESLEDKKETKSKKFSIGSAGGFDIY